MTNEVLQERFTSPQAIRKIVTYLKLGGIAKLGKTTNSANIDLGATFDGDAEASDYVIVVPLQGVSQSSWRTAYLNSIKEHVDVSINGTDVSLQQ